MFIKDDFQTGAPISQVPTSWFNSVAKFINGLVPGSGVSFLKRCDGTPTAISADVTLTDTEPKDISAAASVGESEEAARADHVHAITTTLGGTPSECGSFHTTEVTQTAETLWEIGGDNGATILVLFKGATQGVYTLLYGAKLTFSKAGILTKIEAVENCGERVAS